LPAILVYSLLKSPQDKSIIAHLFDRSKWHSYHTTEQANRSMVGAAPPGEDEASPRG
jgi:hypothetical protein